MAEALIDIATLADRLGTSVRHIRRLVFEKRIPYIKCGGLVRFDPADINRWIDEQRRPVTPRSYASVTSPARPDRAFRHR